VRYIKSMQSRHLMADSVSCLPKNELLDRQKLLCVHYQGIAVVYSRSGNYISQIFQVTRPVVSEFIQLCTLLPHKNAAPLSHLYLCRLVILLTKITALLLTHRDCTYLFSPRKTSSTETHSA